MGWGRPDFERSLIWQIDNAGLPHPVPQYVFARPRLWRFDLAWPEHLIAVEVQGAIWVAGAHARGSGIAKDCEKSCEAAIRGWRVLPIPTDWVADKRGKPDGRALDIITRILRTAATKEGDYSHERRIPGFAAELP